MAFVWMLSKRLEKKQKMKSGENNDSTNLKSGANPLKIFTT